MAHAVAARRLRSSRTIGRSGNASLTCGDLRHQAGTIAENNRIRSPVTGSMRLSLTRGCLTGTAPAAWLAPEARGSHCAPPAVLVDLIDVRAM